MSGGVDSSVTAAMLVRAGHDVLGCFMRLGSPGETLDELAPADACDAAPAASKIGHQGCCSITDAADARLVAAHLGIPLYVCNFKKEFGRIIDYFVGEYADGRTPNPCVRCNDWLKFGKLREYAAQVGATAVASGHYARVREGRLLRGVDVSKDQSYVLFGMPREQIGHTMFPVGDLPKAHVRALAKEWGLPVFDKPDSQEICFVPDQDYAALVERHRPDLARPGPITDTSGRSLGRHDGQHRYTIGQRRGLPLAVGRPLYVVARRAATNTVVVGERRDVQVGACIVGEANFLADMPATEFRALAQFRAHGVAVPGRVRRVDDTAGPTPSGRRGRFEVSFDQPQDAVAPGQALVLYDAVAPDAVVGGGWIESAS
ncbi:MAG: tRNA-specific 2-thiouridylase MnmA [Phycisphaerae bacterium]|nr:MAG: tRNA-specific 2-thiouridylase MnmA [Phycisphaerae bacterium]